MRSRCLPCVGIATVFTAVAALPSSTRSQSFVNWENPPLHAVDVSPDGATLAVVNLPDNRVELLALRRRESDGDRELRPRTAAGSQEVWSRQRARDYPRALGAVSVGLDPVTVRFRTKSELWVVNHISDSVSIVHVPTRRVVATLQTEDEPYDLCFAGSPERAFVSCSQANKIQVFDPSSRALVSTLDLNVEEPRALAVSPDGSQVYVASFRSGNATTLISGGDRRNLIPNVAGGDAAGPLTGVPIFTDGPYGGINPPPNVGGPTTATPTLASFVPPIKPEYLPGGANPAPPVALIVRKSTDGHWYDDNAGDWTEFVSGARAGETLRVVGWDMPDRDVVVIDASTLAVTGYGHRLMNTVMALAVNPASGEVTAVGTECTNEVRFEPNLNGTFLRVHLGIVDPQDLANPSVVDLNAGHLDYSVRNLPMNQREMSVGDPRGIVWNASGTRGYVTGMGSNNVIVIDAAGNRLGRVEVGEGPVGIARDDRQQRLYVLNRFDATISIISMRAPESVVATIPLFDPTPDAIVQGRRHLYDTHETSGLGQASCASCHIDGREDALSWDLGDPGGDMQAVVGTNIPGFQPPGPNAHNLHSVGIEPGYEDWHPMKGPMTTQTLQDIIGKEPFHHRGDKDGIEGFAGAYVSLQADDAPLPPPEMQEFEDYLATIYYPPNPYRNFDNSLPTNLPIPADIPSTGRFALPAGAQLPNGNAEQGMIAFTQTGPNATRCVQCHTIPTGMTTHKRWNSITQEFDRILPGPNGEAHLALRANDTTIHRGNKGGGFRNFYERVGTNYAAAESKTGFGYMNDGREDTIVRRAMATIFNFGSDQAVADFTALMLAFSGFEVDVNPNALNTGNSPGPRSHDTHAAVGKQVTITDANPVPLFGQADAVAAMIALAGATPGRTDLVVKGTSRGWVYDRVRGEFLADDDGETILPGALRDSASAANPLTYTMVPRGSGLRIGLDRDEDGHADRTEVLAGTRPADPTSAPDRLRVAASLNDTSFLENETVELTLEVTPGASPPVIDLYVMLEAPDGTITYLESGGTLTATPTPLFATWVPTAATLPAFNLGVTTATPLGHYTWHVRAHAAGTSDLVAGVAQALFDANLD